jgi:hypothetical protein
MKDKRLPQLSKLVKRKKILSRRLKMNWIDFVKQPSQQSTITEIAKQTLIAKLTAKTKILY